ncbi:helix-turn-helix domain-containing protein [Enterobacter sp. E105B]|uniref:helix-turn-helix domain-containing protein n=1 Tax=Enterobacter sp. E105B TaxID=3047465 RepID=UPI0025A1CEE7|nr:helix-turn-helix domain-containing protein [Enterobacter sp. E105B]
MKHLDFLSYLVNWIEDNLDKELSLEKIADSSCYSKSNLQKVFSNYTIYTLGEYIRFRRISQAAIDLRLTSLSVALIARKYQFKSQESFSRAFKKRFQVTPREYRGMSNWNPKGMVPPLNVEEEKLPAAEFITFTNQIIKGTAKEQIIQRYDQTDSFKRAREKIIKPDEYAGGSSREYYGFHRYLRKTQNGADKGVLYTIMSPSGSDTVTSRVIHGNYLRFSYKGQLPDFQKFIYRLHSWYLPMFNVTISDRMSFERILIPSVKNNATELYDATCYFHLPLAID